MPVVLICEVLDKKPIAFLFDFTGPDGIYLDHKFQENSAKSFRERHLKTCNGMHQIVDCVDPFEMKGI